MEPLPRELCDAAARLEKHWIARVSKLKAKGLSLGDPAYDLACGKLSAVVDEFLVWDED